MGKMKKLLDLYCGAGGAGKGYSLAGFEVMGVDIKPQPRYPFKFHQGDAIEFCLKYGADFDVIHASPPCQLFSCLASLLTSEQLSKHENLIGPTREAIPRKKPYIIENVYGARRELINPIMLCGSQFGLKVYRHRLFECAPYILSPPHFPHRDQTPSAGKGVSSKGFISVVGGGRGTKKPPGSLLAGGYTTVTGHPTNTDYCRMAMGVNWMTGRELSQAIPPAYTKWIGEQFMSILFSMEAMGDRSSVAANRISAGGFGP